MIRRLAHPGQKARSATQKARSTSSSGARGLLTFERAHLLTEGQILRQELRTGEKQSPGHPGTEGYEKEH